MRIFDYSRLKGRTWDSELLGLVAQLHEYKGRQEMYLRQKPADLDRLIEIAKIQSTEASNEIEGIRTTNTRLKQLVQDKTTPHNRDEQEIMGYRDVLNTIHENLSVDNLRILRTLSALSMRMDVLLSFLNHFHLMKHLLPLTVSARTTTVFLPLRRLTI